MRMIDSYFNVVTIVKAYLRARSVSQNASVQNLCEAHPYGSARAYLVIAALLMLVFACLIWVDYGLTSFSMEKLGRYAEQIPARSIVIAAAGMGGLCLFYKYGWRLASVYACGQIAGLSLSYATKFLTGRQRPMFVTSDNMTTSPNSLFDIFSGPWAGSFEYQSFFSSLSFVMAFVCAFLWPWAGKWMRAMLCLLLLFLAVQRVSVGRHYPADVIMAIAVAVVLSIISYKYVMYIWKKGKNRVAHRN